ncbi:hypothetical protein ACFQ6C_26645 [Streptomyces sp. NPDC056454]|uniref:hypothetical protein n=1 Tax=Streptomyces sp. NPDC056454 TaxID=3345823 RepID=UPI0036C77D7D
MPAYMSRGAGVRLVVRTEHRVGLRELTLALYHSNEELGAELSGKAVRVAVTGVLRESGTDVAVKVADYLNEAAEFEDGHAVGSTTGDRLAWARRMVLKAYGADFQRFPDEVAAFESLPLKEIA